MYAKQEVVKIGSSQQMITVIIVCVMSKNNVKNINMKRHLQLNLFHSLTLRTFSFIQTTFCSQTLKKRRSAILRKGVLQSQNKGSGWAKEHPCLRKFRLYRRFILWGVGVDSCPVHGGVMTLFPMALRMTHQRAYFRQLSCLLCSGSEAQVYF